MHASPPRLTPVARTGLATVVAVASLLVSALPPAVAAADRTPGLAAKLRPTHAHDRVIVRYEPGASRARRARSVSDVEVASVRPATPSSTDTVVVQLDPGQTVADAIVTIGAEAGVVSVEPDYWLRPAATSDDPAYVDGDLWGMYGDQTTPANPFGSGAGEAWARGYTGMRNVYVGIVDEGVAFNHPDLKANIWRNPFEKANGKDDDGNGYKDDVYGWDFLNDDATVYHLGDDAHGTHVAGTVGAVGGNGKGVAGVNWKVGLISARFMGDHPIHGSGGFVSDAIKALDYLTDLRKRHGLRIVATTNSYSGIQHSPALLDAIERAGDQGIIHVAAAGNDFGDIDVSPAYPASFTCDRRANGKARGWDCLVSVANLRPDGALEASSGFGATGVDLAAPGTNIRSTYPPDDYATMSGTSMAVPHVAGAVALCASLDRTLTARQIRARLMSTTQPTASLAGKTVTGGRLDVGALAQACAPPPPTTVTTYVDDLDATFKRTGKGWKAGNTGYDAHHFHAPVRQGSRTLYGAWKPTLPAAGRYIVQAWIPREHATSRKAAYKVKGKDGWVMRVRSQFKRRGSWASLGVHELSRKPIVQLADVTGEPLASGRRLAFDAVRFVPYGVPASSEQP